MITTLLCLESRLISVLNATLASSQMIFLKLPRGINKREFMKTLFKTRRCSHRISTSELPKVKTVLGVLLYRQDDVVHLLLYSEPLFSALECLDQVINKFIFHYSANRINC